jgi:hypothetical protein
MSRQLMVPGCPLKMRISEKTTLCSSLLVHFQFPDFVAAKTLWECSAGCVDNEMLLQVKPAQQLDPCRYSLEAFDSSHPSSIGSTVC